MSTGGNRQFMLREGYHKIEQTSVSVVEYSYSHSSSSSGSGPGAVNCVAKGSCCGVASVGAEKGDGPPKAPNVAITVCDSDGGIVVDTV